MKEGVREENGFPSKNEWTYCTDCTLRHNDNWEKRFLTWEWVWWFWQDLLLLWGQRVTGLARRPSEHIQRMLMQSFWRLKKGFSAKLKTFWSRCEFLSDFRYSTNDKRYIYTMKFIGIVTLHYNANLHENVQ